MSSSQRSRPWLPPLVLHLLAAISLAGSFSEKQMNGPEIIGLY
jgi:hypothetical protein